MEVPAAVAKVTLYSPVSGRMSYSTVLMEIGSSVSASHASAEARAMTLPSFSYAASSTSSRKPLALIFSPLLVTGLSCETCILTVMDVPARVSTTVS